MKKKVQVFTVPDQITRLRYGISDFARNLLAVGRTKDALSIYAAYIEFKDSKGRKWQFIGKVYANDFTRAYFSISGVVLSTDSFSFIVCHDFSMD